MASATTAATASPAGAQTLATRLKQAGYQTAAFVGGFPVHSRFGLNLGFDLYDDHFGETGAPTEFVMPERPASVVVAARARLDRGARAGGAGRTGRVEALVRLGASLRSACTVPAAGAVRRAVREAAVLRGSRGDRCSAGAAVRRAARVRAADSGGRHRRSRRRAGRSRRADARTVCLRGDAASAADHGGGRRGGTGTERRAEAGGAKAGGEVSAVAARHVDILPTILEAVGQAAPANLSGRSLLPAAERRAGAAPRTATSKRWARCSIAAGRRCPVCWRIATS